MRIPIKTKEEINIMREGGRILAEILETLRKYVCEGISTKYLDEKAEDLIKKYKVEPSFKNYQGYPACICSSVNEEVVHAIPSPKKILQTGDIISIDCGIIYKGFNLDATITTYIEPIPSETKQFLKNTLKILDKAISQTIQGARVGDISNAIEKTAKEYGYSPVRELTGHGVGRKLHEPPQIPNYGQKNTGELLLPGMTLAIEPIINQGERYIKTLKDGWTVVTQDNSLSIQVEHTVLITTKGNEILTKI